MVFEHSSSSHWPTQCHGILGIPTEVLGTGDLLLRIMKALFAHFDLFVV